MSILETYLLQHIPISGAMGIAVELATPEKVVLRAPFLNNINHKRTVFGGSLHAVATLACWSLLHLNVKGQIVIASSEVAYLAPVAADFTAECLMPDPAEWEKFTASLGKKGKGRIKLKAQIVQEGRLCVDFSGVFVCFSNGS